MVIDICEVISSWQAAGEQKTHSFKKKKVSELCICATK